MTPTVLPGIDVLLRTGPGPLAGTRVGLITNHTGIIALADASGDTVSTMDMLHPTSRGRALFSPEHSSTARSEAGARPHRADVAIDTASVGGPTTTQIADIGDLAEVEARDTLDAAGLFIHFPAGTEAVQPASAFEAVLRRSPDPASQAVGQVDGTPKRELSAR